jgi:hypothetical protein
MEPMAMNWTKDQTERYLTNYPLPAEFVWCGRLVRPSHRTLKKGYGFWLRTTPYHRGLFAACHAVLETCEILPTGEELAEAVTRGVGQQTTLLGD